MSVAWPTYQAAPMIDVPPWGWNPAATFQTAFNEAQKEKRAQEEFQIGMELERYLLPIKKKQAQLSLANMELQMEKTKGALEIQTARARREAEVYKNITRGQMQAVTGEGASRYGSGVSTLVQNYLSGGRPAASGGGGGTKKLGQGYTGDE